MPRPPLGVEIVNDLEATDESKRRLKAVLQVISKEKTVEAACQELGIERARFYQLEKEALLAACEALAPKPPGRPARGAPTAEQRELRAWKERCEELEVELLATQVREELATVLPDVARRAKKPREKKLRRPF